MKKDNFGMFSDEYLNHINNFLDELQVVKPKNDIKTIEKKLKKALKKEEYLKCAKYRDLLKQLKTK